VDTTAPTKEGLLCKPGLTEPVHPLVLPEPCGSNWEKLLGIDGGGRYVAPHVNQLTMPGHGSRITVIAPRCVATQGEFDGR
jgi:hypothetical protein